MSDPAWDNLFQTFQPSPEQVRKLIDAAQNHPLGVKFLMEGDLGTVAITFQTHAFTVEAARDQLKELE